MIAFLLGLILGIVGAVLVIRNNAARAAKLDDQGKKLLDALKGK
jgi:hypothetical protein